LVLAHFGWFFETFWINHGAANSFHRNNKGWVGGGPILLLADVFGDWPFPVRTPATHDTFSIIFFLSFLVTADDVDIPYVLDAASLPSSLIKKIKKGQKLVFMCCTGTGCLERNLQV
jgi:hypothetical protein